MAASVADAARRTQAHVASAAWIDQTAGPTWRSELPDAGGPAPVDGHAPVAQNDRGQS
jgi:hypothetical protein